MDYRDFLINKSHTNNDMGFTDIELPDFLFDFQKVLVQWALQKGRAAIFADCGLGKTPMQLVWADNVMRKTNKPVLVLTPLAVSYQTIQEGNKFDIDCFRTNTGEVKQGVINVTNYERLHYYNPNDFSGVVCDESSILKNFSGSRRKEITAFLRKMEYRLLCTATASPNDFVELGTSSEALGNMGHMEVMSTFFRAPNKRMHVSRRYNDFWNSHKFIFKPHSQEAFWRWVCSWGRILRKPSDIGFDDNGFILPALNINEHMVKNEHVPDGELFPRIAQSLNQERDERRQTLKERCNKVAELVSSHNRSALIWCHFNVEGDMLEKMIPGAKQVKGGNTDEAKEKNLLGFINGDFRVLVTKPKIGAFGLNFQHCSDMVFFPTHSFEQYYQGVRRCWRYGQKNNVNVDIVSSEGEVNVIKNLRSKAKKSDIMFDNMIKHANNELDMTSLLDDINKTITTPTWI